LRDYLYNRELIAFLTHITFVLCYGCKGSSNDAVEQWCVWCKPAINVML